MERTLRYDHYKVLGIPRNATSSEVKRAYRERAKGCHPDRNPSPLAAAVFQAVHEAYSVLGDDASRARYDERLRYYREAAVATEDPSPATRRSTYRGAPVKRDEGPVRPIHRFAFYGLHLTGLLSGMVLVGTILVGIVFQGWPLYALLFCIPGMAAIPDSIEGLRTR